MAIKKNMKDKMGFNTFNPFIYAQPIWHGVKGIEARIQAYLNRFNI